jgi:hypothetical protein
VRIFDVLVFISRSRPQVSPAAPSKVSKAWAIAANSNKRSRRSDGCPDRRRIRAQAPARRDAVQHRSRATRAAAARDEPAARRQRHTLRIERAPKPRLVFQHRHYRDGYGMPVVEETLALALS